MTLQTIILIAATLSTGMMSGIFFTWTNAVKPGIGKLDDFGYLSALKSMNRVILNTQFRALFIAAVILIPIAAALSYSAAPDYLFWLLVAAAIIYELGTFAVTFLGSIPLNRMVENADLSQLSIEGARNLRARVEGRWNRLNRIRTVTSLLAFVVLAYAVLML